MTLIGLNSNVFTPVATGDAPAVTPTSAQVNNTSEIKMAPQKRQV